MKKTILILGVAFLFACISSCSKKDECHECHIAYFPISGGDEIEVEIGEFCGSALEDVESNGYHLDDPVVEGNDTIPAGHYEASEIHCEEHADH